MKPIKENLNKSLKHEKITLSVLNPEVRQKKSNFWGVVQNR